MRTQDGPHPYAHHYRDGAPKNMSHAANILSNNPSSDMSDMSHKMSGVLIFP